MPGKRRYGKRGKKFTKALPRNMGFRAHVGRFGVTPVQVQRRFHGWKREVVGPSSLIPKRKLMNLKYAFEFNLNCGVAQTAVFKIRANSAYDPEDAVGGHSAFMFDDIMRFYSKYRVVSARLKVWYVNPAVSDQIPFYMTILKSTDGNMYQQFASSAHILEAPNSVRGNIKVVGQFANAVQTSLNASQKPTCNAYYSQRQYYPGIKDENFEAVYNMNPAHINYFEILQFPLGGNNPPLAYFRAELTQNVLFSEPLLLPESGINSSGFGLEGGTGPQGAILGNEGVTAGMTGHGGHSGFGPSQS